MADTLTLDNAVDNLLPFSWADDKGVAIDISGSDVVLYVRTCFNVTAGLDPNNPKGRLFEITAAQAQTLGSKTHEYLVIIDGTAIRGTITSTGWVPV